jgi:hypothetical protein
VNGEHRTYPVINRTAWDVTSVVARQGAVTANLAVICS